MVKQCPYCGKEFKEQGVLGHIRLAHPAEFAKYGYKIKKIKRWVENVVKVAKTQEKLKKDGKMQNVNASLNKNSSLLKNKLKKTAKKGGESLPKTELKKEDLVGKSSESEDYRCAECGAPVKKFQKFCASCGAELDWSAAGE